MYLRSFKKIKKLEFFDRRVYPALVSSYNIISFTVDMNT